jgi:hypothetical protein
VTRVTENQTLNLNSKFKMMDFDTNRLVSNESFDRVVFSSLASECSKYSNSHVLKPSKDLENSINFGNKQQGINVSRYIRDKSKKVSNIDSPIHIEDTKLNEFKIILLKRRTSHSLWGKL